MTWSRLVIFPLLALSMVGSARAQGGSSGGTLSPRTHYVAFHRGQPPAAITLLLVLRAQPGWESRSSSSSGMAIASATAGSSASGGPGRPMRYSISIGDVQFECRYDPDRHVLTWNGRDYQLDDDNVVLIDRIDGVGGSPEIARRLKLQLPGYTGTTDMIGRIRGIPELQEFLR
jgi:hypothetical protein